MRDSNSWVSVWIGRRAEIVFALRITAANAACRRGARSGARALRSVHGIARLVTNPRAQDTESPGDQTSNPHRAAFDNRDRCAKREIMN